MYFGTPNGQASTQFEHPMQRCLSADCTMPVSVCLIASAGHTSVAGRILAVRAHHRCGLCVVSPVDTFEVDQRLTTMRAALHTGLNARLAPDASALVDHEHR